MTAHDVVLWAFDWRQVAATEVPPAMNRDRLHVIQPQQWIQLVALTAGVPRKVDPQTHGAGAASSLAG